MNTQLLEPELERPTSALVTEQRIFQIPVISPSQYLTNKIRTSKYTLLSFFPKVIYQQFKKLANVYFLVISVMQAIPQISVSEGIPNLLLPLVIVVIFSAIKDLLEDLKRKRSDRDENNCITLKRVSMDWRKSYWHEIQVGDLVKVTQNEYFPADLLLLCSSDSKGISYIETKNLDGETNLKHKIASRDTQIFFEFEARLDEMRGSIKCPEANPLLYHFDGIFNMGKKGIPLEYNHLLLRGSSLRNTDWIIGLVIYTGHETKIMLNSPRAKQKSSKLESQMNREILHIFLLQVFLCIFAAIYYAVWYNGSKNNTEVYLELRLDNQTPLTQLVFQFFTWMLLLTNFVPISLLVTLEMVRYVQAMFISSDLCMYYAPYDMCAGVQSSNLNEELGQINYVFSDKTGTLTCNVMEFRKLSVFGRSFGTAQHLPEALKQPNIDFVDASFDPRERGAEELLFLLACCHTVIAHHTGNAVVYNSSSPDELALVNAARFFGVEFLDRGDSSINVSLWGRVVTVKVLNILEFTSERKRMSVIAKMPDGKIKLFCKGADNKLIPLLVNADMVQATSKHLEDYAREGLRTLVLACRDLKEAEYRTWKSLYDDALTDRRNKKSKLEEVEDLIETNLTLVGATAIEDKLQEGVPETIQFLRSVGIKVWVLTGDKIETAVNIGFSCGLLTDEIIRITVQSLRTLQIRQEIEKGLEAIKSSHMKFGLIIAGDALLKTNKPEIRQNLLTLALGCSVVLACRVSPQQKADLVRLIKNNDRDARTLSIGDGANDVNMICAAHVGVGIAGLEGQQAVRASDYAIAQFSYLKRLLFVHGRECYRKNAVLICYNFYKNVFITIPLFYYGIFSVFSGQVLYNMWSYNFFNIFFAAYPICLYAMFDKQYDFAELNTQSNHYELGLMSKLFSSKVFWLWIVEASLQGLCVLIVCVFSICKATGNEYTGKMDNMWVASELIFGVIVVMVNLKVVMLSYSNFWFTLGINFVCTASYFVFAWVLTEWAPVDIFFDNYDSLGSTYRMAINPNTYAAGLVVVVMGFLAQPVIRRIVEICKKKQVIGHERTISEDEKDQARKDMQELYVPHTGFAFSGEAGHVPQIINPEIFE